MGIVVAAYDPAWPKHAETEIERVAAALSGTVDAVEHIGSTSVPGLAAKPIIDIMAAAPDLDAARARTPGLGALGYVFDDNRMPGRLFFHKAEGAMPVNLHIVRAETWPTRSQRILRDHLREHPEDARRYGDLKRSLAGGPIDGDAYTRAKTGLIQELMDRARADRGLPPVDVWEE